MEQQVEMVIMPLEVMPKNLPLVEQIELGGTTLSRRAWGDIARRWEVNT